MNTEKLVTLSAKTPTYLFTLINENEEIILVYTVKDVDNEVFGSPNSCGNTDDNTFMDITGSPLKVTLDTSDLLCLSMYDPLCNPWTNAEEKHFPVSIDVARKVITDYCSKNRRNSDAKAMWCICDAQDQNKTVLLASQQTPQFIMRATVTLEGFVPLSHPSLDLEAVSSKHLEYVDCRIEKKYFIREKKKVPLRDVDSKVFSVYDIVGSRVSSIGLENDTNAKGSVVLEVSWNRYSRIPTDLANCSMLIQAAVGHRESQALNMWKDLILLELYVKTLSEYNCERIVDNYWMPSSPLRCKDENLIERISEIIQTCSTNTRHHPKFEGKDLHSVIEFVNIKPSKDITDQLWTILTQSNMTGIAEIIRGIAAGKLAVPSCTGTQPIELLIEIGMEKLKRDYILIFTSCGIADSQELQDFFSNNISEAMRSNAAQVSRNRGRLLLASKQPVISLEYIEKTMKALGQLHVVLEILSIIPQNCIPCTSTFIYNKYTGPESPIDSFCSLTKNKLQEIRVDVLYSDVHQNVNRISPMEWRLTLKSTRPSYTVITVLHLSQRSIFPPSIYKLDSHDTTFTTKTTETCYHCTRLVQIISRLT